jgi:formate dehydrogenase iron-sulfur subunit
VILLVLSQLAIGASVAALVVKPALPMLLGAFAVGLVAMIAGSLHLGQPLKAWRSFLGWRKSWFSREVIAFGGFVSMVAAAAGAKVWSSGFSRFGLPEGGTPNLGNCLALAAALAGLSTVVCSAMIYVDTRREYWNALRSFAKFFGTTLLLGLAATGLVLPSKTAFALLALVAVAKLVFENQIFVHLVEVETPAQTPLNKTARLLAGELNGFVRARIAFGLLGGVVLPLIGLLQLAAGTTPATALAAVLLVLCVAGELIERYLFFTAVVTQKMPGGLAV